MTEQLNEFDKTQDMAVLNEPVLPPFHIFWFYERGELFFSPCDKEIEQSWLADYGFDALFVLITPFSQNQTSRKLSLSSTIYTSLLINQGETTLKERTIKLGSRFSSFRCEILGVSNQDGKFYIIDEQNFASMDSFAPDVKMISHIYAAAFEEGKARGRLSPFGSFVHNGRLGQADMAQKADELIEKQEPKKQGEIAKRTVLLDQGQMGDINLPARFIRPQTSFCFPVMSKLVRSDLNSNKSRREKQLKTNRPNSFFNKHKTVGQGTAAGRTNTHLNAAIAQQYLSHRGQQSPLLLLKLDEENLASEAIHNLYYFHWHHAMKGGAQRADHLADELKPIFQALEEPAVASQQKPSVTAVPLDRLGQTIEIEDSQYFAVEGDDILVGDVIGFATSRSGAQVQFQYIDKDNILHHSIDQLFFIRLGASFNFLSPALQNLIFNRPVIGALEGALSSVSSNDVHLDAEQQIWSHFLNDPMKRNLVHLLKAADEKSAGRDQEVQAESDTNNVLPKGNGSKDNLFPFVSYSIKQTAIQSELADRLKSLKLTNEQIETGLKANGFAQILIWQILDHDPKLISALLELKISLDEGPFLSISKKEAEQLRFEIDEMQQATKLGLLRLEEILSHQNEDDWPYSSLAKQAVQLSLFKRFNLPRGNGLEMIQMGLNHIQILVFSLKQAGQMWQGWTEDIHAKLTVISPGLQLTIPAFDQEVVVPGPQFPSDLSLKALKIQLGKKIQELYLKSEPSDEGDQMIVGLAEAINQVRSPSYLQILLNQIEQEIAYRGSIAQAQDLLLSDLGLGKNTIENLEKSALRQEIFLNGASDIFKARFARAVSALEKKVNEKIHEKIGPLENLSAFNRQKTLEQKAKLVKFAPQIVWLEMKKQYDGRLYDVREKLKGLIAQEQGYLLLQSHQKRSDLLKAMKHFGALEFEGRRTLDQRMQQIQEIEQFLG